MDIGQEMEPGGHRVPAKRVFTMYRKKYEAEAAKEPDA